MREDGPGGVGGARWFPSGRPLPLLRAMKFGGGAGSGLGASAPRSRGEPGTRRALDAAGWERCRWGARSAFPQPPVPNGAVSRVSPRPPPPSSSGCRLAARGSSQIVSPFRKGLTSALRRRNRLVGVGRSWSHFAWGHSVRVRLKGGFASSCLHLAQWLSSPGEIVLAAGPAVHVVTGG